MDHPTAILRYFLLAVVFSPLAAGALAWAIGRAGAVRRFAAWFTLLHLGVSVAMALLVTASVSGRAGPSEEVRADVTFMPAAVPGDPGFENDSYTTTWNLFTLRPPHPHQPPTEVQFFLGLDGLNLWLVVLSSLMTAVAVLVSWGSVTERAGGYYGWLLALEGLTCGAFTAFDVIVFYVFFELTLIPAFFLIGRWGVGGGRRDAARKFFLYTLAGSLLTLTGLVGVVLTNPTPVNPTSQLQKPMDRILLLPNGRVLMPAEGSHTFSIRLLAKNAETWSTAYHARAHVAEQSLARAIEQAVAARARLAAGNGTDPEQRRAAEVAEEALKAAEQEASVSSADRDSFRRLQTWLFVLLMAGLAVKIPIVPFHTWLPAAYSEAPAGVTIVLAAVLSKLGTYGVIRLVLPFTPDAALAYGLPVFGALGAAGVIYAAFCAFAQRDMKLLVAYSSISHLGLLVLGLFAFNAEGLAGASLHMVNHGLSTGALFAVLAVLAARYRTLDMGQYGGLWARYPGLTFLAFVIALASVGVPGLNNFVSEMLILAGLFDPPNTRAVSYLLAGAAAAGIFLSAWYTMTWLRRVFFGPLVEPPVPESAVGKLTGQEALALLLPAGLCVLLGVFPQPILTPIRTDAAVVARFGESARIRAMVEIAPSKAEQNFRPRPLPPGAEQGPVAAGVGMGGAPKGGPNGPPARK